MSNGWSRRGMLFTAGTGAAVFVGHAASMQLGAGVSCGVSKLVTEFVAFTPDWVCHVDVEQCDDVPERCKQSGAVCEHAAGGSFA